jgi:predicted AAA+ superfamily ATPase
MPYFKRKLEHLLEQTLAARPLVYLSGPRQVGKSTLAEYIGKQRAANYVSFDSPLAAASAQSDPVSFIKSLPRNQLNIIDEVQLVPEVFRQFKIEVDASRQQGRRGLYLLTGSAKILALPELSDALVGRMSILTLLPFSCAERRGTGKNFVQHLWDNDFGYAKYENSRLEDAIVGATYPEIALDYEINRTQWFDDYLATIVQRDIKTLADIRASRHFLHLIVALALRVGSLLNNASVIRDTGLDAKTYAKYKELLHNTFLTFEIESWAKPNKLDKRFVKQSKLYFNDTNLLCHIMRRNLTEVLKNDPSTGGHIFENFVATEIMKNTKTMVGTHVSHFNLVGGKEVDFVIENENADVLGIEVKLSGSVSDSDFSNMRILRGILGERFRKGVVIYSGNELALFKDEMLAIPVNYLWE